MESAIEKTKHEFNDGFKGRLKPTYDLSNFQKSYSKTTLQYDNKSEIPVFNIFKVHGSLNWEKEDDVIIHSNLSHLQKVQDELLKLEGELYTIQGETTIENLIVDAKKPVASDKEANKESVQEFLKAYDKILVVNPTKEKFKRTVIDDKFYELLRLYANSLEKENSLLFVLGFSFADEHICDITLRAANSNPTLQIIVFAFNDDEQKSIEKKLKISDGLAKNSNIKVISHSGFLKDNYPIVKANKEKYKNIKQFDFKTIVEEVFEPIADLIRDKNTRNEK